MAFVRFADGEAEAIDRERLQSLIAGGMLVEDPASPGLRQGRPIKPAKADLLQYPGPRSNLLDVASAFAAEAKAAWRLRTRPFHKVMEEAGRDLADRPRRADGEHERLRRIASASMAISLVLRASDRCMVRALAVHATCRRQGICSALVLGVRMHPFGAHCWVQHGETVLVGDFEQVRLFTPIAAFG